MRTWLRRSWAPALAAVLALSLVAGAAAAALAGSGKDKGKDKGHEAALDARARILAQVALQLGFKDLDEAAWALRHIAELSLKGVIKGRGHGKVAPRAAVSRAEVLAMVARATGQEQRAQQLAAQPCTLTFADAQAIRASASWAVGYICLALEKGWIAPGGAFQPHKAASRVWVAEVLVKAMGATQAELQAAAQQPLAFKDAHAIPAEARPYVVLAIQRGLITGYEDGRFQPHKPVTRAELAAMIGRMQGQTGTPPQVPESLYARGWLRAVQGGNLVVAVKQGNVYVDKTFALAAQAVVFLGEEPAALADLRPGDRLELFLDASGKVTFVFARYEPIELEGQVTAAGQTSLSLRIEEVELDRDDNPVPLPVSYAPGQTVTLAVYGGAKVKVDGQIRTWSPDLVRAGDEVEARVHVDTVVSLTVEDRDDDEDDDRDDAVHARFEGVLVAKETVQGVTRIQVRVTDNDDRHPVAVDANGVAAVAVRADAAIRFRGKPLSLDAVPPGSVVEVELEEGTAVRVTLERLPGADDRATGRVRGQITGLGFSGGHVALDLTVLGDIEGLVPGGVGVGGKVTARVLPQTRITVNGAAATLGDLRIGDAGRFTFENESLLGIDIVRQ